MKTAIDWLVSELPTIDWDDPYYRDKLEQAKAMEKEVIMVAYDYGHEGGTNYWRRQTAKEYYNETFD